MIDQAFAARFAGDRIEASNAHDLGRILLHYAEDFEMVSRAIKEVVGEPSGALREERQ